MTLLFDPHGLEGQPLVARRARGRMAQLAGLAAEDSVERHYVLRGAAVLARRWRGKGGEIDMVLRDATGLVFVEVKQAPDFDRAAAALGPRQIARLCIAAQEFAGDQPDGLLSDMRFDLATVDGQGRVQVLENAFGEF